MQEYYGEDVDVDDDNDEFLDEEERRRRLLDQRFTPRQAMAAYDEFGALIQPYQIRFRPAIHVEAEEPNDRPNVDYHGPAVYDTFAGYEQDDGYLCLPNAFYFDGPEVTEYLRHFIDWELFYNNLNDGYPPITPAKKVQVKRYFNLPQSFVHTFIPN